MKRVPYRRSDALVFIFPSFLLFVLVLWNATAWSGEEKTGTIAMTVDEAVTRAIEKNLVLEQEKYNAPIAEANIEVRKGDFDPSVMLNILQSRNKVFLPDFSWVNDSKTFQLAPSFGGKLVTGTKYTLTWNNQWVTDSSSSSYLYKTLNLALAQPLLKGFGIANQTANLRVAENTYDIAKLDFANKMTAIAAQTAMLYWDLKIAADRLETDTLALELSRKLYKKALAKIAAGNAEDMDINSALLDMAQKEQSLLEAQKQILDAQDSLRSIIDLEEWATTILPVTQPPPAAPLAGMDEILNTSLEQRWDYRKMFIDKKNAEIMLRYYDNQRLPSLDVVAGYGLGVLSNNPAATMLSQISTGNQLTWQLGLILSIPIGNNAGKGNYHKAQYDLDKVEVSLQDMKKNIIVEVREARRGAEYAIKMMKATEKTRLAAQKKLEVESANFEKDETDLSDLLDYQTDYVNALYDEKKARSDYAKALVKLKKTQGEMP